MDTMSAHQNKPSRTLRQRRRKKKLIRPLISTSSEYVVLCQWMKRNKYRKPPLISATFSGTGRGLMSLAPIRPGSVIVSIPYHLLITQETVFNTLSLYLQKWSKKLTAQQATSLFLISERQKKDSSFWFPYINILPREYSTPAFFTSFELDLLPEPVRAKAAKQIAKVHLAFNTVLEFINKCWLSITPVVTLSNFLWAWYSVNTRSVYYKHNLCKAFEDDGNYFALAPFLDLLNHSCDAKINAEFNPISNCYEIRTADTYKKYDQVFISYGNHDNTHLLIEYGFTVPNNPNDAVDFDFDKLLDVAVMMDLEFFKEKKTILLCNNFDKKLCCSADGLSWNLQVAVRVFAMDWNEMRNWKCVMQGSVISNKNEALAKKMVSTLVTSEMNIYKEALRKFTHQHRDMMTDHERLAYDISNIQLTTLQLAMQCVQ